MQEGLEVFDLNGKSALVTGSSQGIGLEIARVLARHGAKVFVHASKSMDKAKKAADEIGGDAACIVADLSENCASKSLYKQTGDVDILVINASVQVRCQWDKISSEDFDRQIKVNLKSSLELMQLYGEHMKNQGWGRIVTVGSVQQYKPHVHMAVYAASKCAQMSLVENIGKQLAPFGVTVNNLSPGVIATPRNEQALSDKEYAKKVMEGIPAGYAGEAKDCAAAALLLCSEEGRYITGTDLIVDGGMHL